jgi:hypothetical protein
MDHIVAIFGTGFHPNWIRLGCGDLDDLPSSQHLRDLEIFLSMRPLHEAVVKAEVILFFSRKDFQRFFAVLRVIRPQTLLPCVRFVVMRTLPFRGIVTHAMKKWRQ